MNLLRIFRGGLFCNANCPMPRPRKMSNKSQLFSSAWNAAKYAQYFTGDRWERPVDAAAGHPPADENSLFAIYLLGILLHVQ